MKIYIVADKPSKEHLLSEVESKKAKYLTTESVTVISSVSKLRLTNFLLLIEDDVNDFLVISKAASLSKEFNEVVICDRVATSLHVIGELEQAPLLSTLDFKIGDESTVYTDTSQIYFFLKKRFSTTEVIGYTNYEKPGEDEIGNQAKKLIDLLTANNESIYDKYSLSHPVALANIFRDKIRISKYEREKLEITAENQKLKRELEYTETALPTNSGKDYIVGSSLPMRLLYKELQQLKGITPNVLIIGERGTGKELIAKAIREDSPLGLGTAFPYVEVNCAEFSDDNNSIISELFGHVKGAFTGAITGRRGVFEVANNGTVFLDEIGTLTKTVQEKLLRFLETGKYNKLGDEFTKLPSKVRLICATNANLDEMKSKGEFRKDFYDRIATVELHIPNLNERAEDIGELTDYLISNSDILKKNFGNDKIRFTISTDAKALLLNQKFEGNIRDLKNVLIRAMIKARSSSNNIEATHITESLRSENKSEIVSNNDCSEAKTFLNNIQKIILENYPTKQKVTQDDIRVHFITVTGQTGVSRKEFIEKYFSPHKPCIEKLISEKGNPWEDIISKCGFIRNAKSKM